MTALLEQDEGILRLTPTDYSFNVHVSNLGKTMMILSGNRLISILILQSLFSTPALALFAEEVAPIELEQRVTAASRPRLFLSDGVLQRLRAQLEGPLTDRWRNLRLAASQMGSQSPPAYREPRIGGDETRPGTLNDEMLWQRQYGYVLPGLALTALLDPDPKYFAMTREWALTPGTYPLWGAGIYENTGLAAKHQLVGLAIAYDWLYDRWSPEDRRSLLATLREHGRILYEAAEGINDRGWWKDTWKQNHAWNGYQALAVTAIAVMGEEPAAGTWLAKALWGGRNIIAALPDEGAYEEGLPYWGYGMEALIRFTEAVKPYAPDDFYSHPYFSNTYLFRLHLAGPDVGQIANFGDGRTTDWHAMMTTMHRLASQYQNPVAQWLANSLPERSDLDATCWDLIWYDSTLSGELPADTPLSHTFPETGFAGARTSWSKDAITVHLRSGKADVSHSHLDVNNFLLNVAGEWLLRDYGYGEVGPGYFNKEQIYFSTGTVGHNCLVINRDHQRKAPDSEGTITDAVDLGDLVWWRSDATSCYEGAISVVRELSLVRPGESSQEPAFVVVRDHVVTEEPAAFDFMLQPHGRITLDRNQFIISGSDHSILGVVAAPDQVESSLSTGLGEKINVEDPLTLRVSAPGKRREVEFRVVLVPFKNGAPLPTLASSPDKIRVEGVEYRFSHDGRSAPQISRPTQ